MTTTETLLAEVVTDEMVLAAINADRHEQYRVWGRTVQETHGSVSHPTKVERVNWEPRTSLDQFEPVLVARTRAALSAALACLAKTQEILPCGCETPLNAVHILDH